MFCQNDTSLKYHVIKTLSTEMRVYALTNFNYQNNLLVSGKYANNLLLGNVTFY